MVIHSTSFVKNRQIASHLGVGQAAPLVELQRIAPLPNINDMTPLSTLPETAPLSNINDMTPLSTVPQTAPLFNILLSFSIKSPSPYCSVLTFRDRYTAELGVSRTLIYTRKIG